MSHSVMSWRNKKWENYSHSNTIFFYRNVENTYPAMIGITDDQGAMCFLGLVIAINFIGAFYGWSRLRASVD